VPLHDSGDATTLFPATEGLRAATRLLVKDGFVVPS
jgi:thiazole synthase ThiGH ThiG subunit